MLHNIQEQLNDLSSLINDCCEKNIKKSDSGQNFNNNINYINVFPESSQNKCTELFQNNPNPFKTITTFSYQLSNNGFTDFEITDQYGQLVEKLVNCNQEAGNYSVDWNSVKVPAGIYYYSLKVNGLLLVKKAIKIN